MHGVILKDAEPTLFGIFFCYCFSACAKVVQHADIKELLLQTEQRVIVENAGKHDAWWGAGADGTGQNMLGRVLMYVRSILQDAEDKTFLEKAVEAFKKQ